MKTKIEWATDVWNPVTGCTKISAGCAHCYAERMSKRLGGRFGYPADKPFNVTLHHDKLDEPLHWKKPRRVFVCSMGDLFHQDVPDEFVREVFWRMDRARWHTFMVLTKRPERMASWLADKPCLPNVWLGTSVENQQAADERIPWLLNTPAAVRFVSCEPLLGPVNMEVDLLGRHFITTWSIDSEVKILPKLDWVICGGETGPGARPMHPLWALSLRNQCVNANVPFFFKRWGDWEPVGKTIEDKGNYLAVGEGFRWGKTAVGHLLEGREWRDMPEVKS